MPALVAGTHVFGTAGQGVDGRDFRREDGASRLSPGHDTFSKLKEKGGAAAPPKFRFRGIRYRDQVVSNLSVAM
jgi:hypothetical protein